MTQNKKNQYNTENYIPMMTVIKKTKLTPEDVKKVISQRYIVTQRDNNVYIFSANTKI